jgi:hypothetical protein
MVRQLLVAGEQLIATSLHHTSINDLISTYRKHPLGVFVDGELYDLVRLFSIFTCDSISGRAVQ